MYELISQPGLQFYVYRLSGTLKYIFTVAGRSPRNFVLHDTDFDPEDADGVVKYEECLSIQGMEASAVGLKLKLVKNNGILDIQFQGRDGSTAHWTFRALQEAGNKTGMYASASTQTCIASFVIRGKQTTHERLFSAKCEAFVRSKGFRITSIICKDADEALWTVSSDGEAKRQLDGDQSSVQVGTTQNTSIATRISARKRARTEVQIPFATAETLPRYLFLSGSRDENELEQRFSPTGDLRVDREAGKIAFWTWNGWLIDEDIIPNDSNKVQLQPHEDKQRLQILHNDLPVFTSYHLPGAHATGNHSASRFPMYSVHMTDFIKALETCLLPDVPTTTKKDRKTTTRAEH